MFGLLGTTVPRTAYVAVFVVTALVCLVAVGRTRRIDDREVRIGLASLLAISGLWSGFQATRLAVRSPTLQRTFYTLGLLVGFASVGAWLYFCSAYTGHSYHRDPVVRRLAAGLYLLVVGIKLTNPIHGAYYTTTRAMEPFAHLVVVQGTVHWVVTTVAYALSAVGFYLLFELYTESSQDTAILGFLVSLTAAPVALDVLGYLAPIGLDLNYEPIGVALFAVGVLYATEERFFAVATFGRPQILDQLEDPIVLLDRSGAIRDVNDSAVRIFPELADAVGEPLAGTLPSVAAAGDDPVAVTENGEQRYYLLTETPLTVAGTRIGRGLVFDDVTAIERHRRELTRQNEQLESFAEAINHELRNTLGIVTGYLELADDALGTTRRGGSDAGGRVRTTDRPDTTTLSPATDDASPADVDLATDGASPADTDPATDGTPTAEADPGSEVDPSVETGSTPDPAAVRRAAVGIARAADSAERMSRLIDELSTVARYGRTVDESGPCPFGSTVRNAWSGVGNEVALSVTDGPPVRADDARLEELFRTVAEFARLNGADRVTVVRTADGFTITDDGRPVDPDDAERALTYGEAVPDAESGLLLPTVRTLAGVHGWSVGLDPEHRDGVRLVVSDVPTASPDDGGDADGHDGSDRPDHDGAADRGDVAVDGTAGGGRDRARSP